MKNNNYFSREARSYDYEFEEHEIDGIKFKTTIFDTDYMDNGYEFPNTDEKVVLFRGGYSWLHETNDTDSMDFILCITNWNEFKFKQHFYDYFLTVMVFDHNINNYDIIKVFQKYNILLNYTINKNGERERNDPVEFVETMKKEFSFDWNLDFNQTIIFNTENMIIENYKGKKNDIVPFEIIQDNGVVIIKTNIDDLFSIQFPNDINSYKVVVLKKFVFETKHHHNSSYNIRKYYYDKALYKIYTWNDFQMEYIPDFNKFGYYDISKLHDETDIGIISFSEIIIFPEIYDNQFIHEYIKNYIYDKYNNIYEIQDYILKIRTQYKFDESLNYQRGIVFDPKVNNLTNYSKI